MTTQIFFSANKLGVITDKQVQQMLDRFNLGKLISFTKTSKGVGNQTMFVNSSSGEYVLKGNPLYESQFIEEKFYIDHLHEITKLPVPFPYRLDEQDDIFGWNYAVMPRLPGRHFNDPDFQVKLNVDDKKRIAELLVECLCELHHWTAEFYGEFDPTYQHHIRPFEGSYKAWLFHRIRYWLADAKKYSEITARDVAWVEDLLLRSEEAFHNLRSSSFVMGDFKADNILIRKTSKGWKLSGIFDFTTGYFGDGVADLPRIVAMYQENGDEEVSRHFISEYFNRAANQEGFKERFKVHMLHQRILDWGCAKAINDVTWDDNLSFSQWAEAYTEAAAFLY